PRAVRAGRPVARGACGAGRSRRGPEVLPAPADLAGGPRRRAVPVGRGRGELGPRALPAHRRRPVGGADRADRPRRAHRPPRARRRDALDSAPRVVEFRRAARAATRGGAMTPRANRPAPAARVAVVALIGATA